MRRFVIASLAAVACGGSFWLAAGCMNAPTMTAAVKDYLPLAAGNSWRFYVTQNSGVAVTNRYEQASVIARESKDGKSAFKVQIKITDAGGGPGPSLDETHWADDGQEFQENAGHDDCKWITALRYPPVENIEWKHDCHEGGASFSYDFRTRARENVKLDVNGESYPNSAKVTTRMVIGFAGQSETYEIHRWYAAGIGPVKLEFYDRTPASTTYNVMVVKHELVAHTVADP